MADVVSGEREAALNVAIREHFNPGDELMLKIRLPKEITRAELKTVADKLVDRGIDVHRASLMGTAENAVFTLDFTNPKSLKGVSVLAFLPIITLLAEVGATGALLWQVSKATTLNWLSMVLLAGIVFIIGGGLYKQGKKQRA